MTTNINRNSIHAIRTTYVGWLEHSNIPNLSIGTEQDFTIQVYFILGNGTDGMLYGQEGGFSLQLADGIPVFQMSGFATLSADETWRLRNHSYYCIAVRYGDHKLAMFINGILVAEKAASPTTACAGKFFMGKRMTGGLTMVRVSAAALTDDNILHHNANMPEVDENCVFQTDFETAQYQDVSSNHLGIWKSGEGAGCCMFTACTAFERKGYKWCRLKEKLTGDHTLLLKIYPLSCSERQRLYKAADGDDIVYSVDLVPKDNGGFTLCITDGTKDVLSEVELVPNSWQDIALAFSGGKVQVYLDGSAHDQLDFTPVGGREKIFLGGESDDTNYIPHNCFDGYMAYAAEFGRILDAQAIGVYTDDPPFLFEEGLSALLLLDWKDNIEYISRTVVNQVGYAEFSMIPDTTPLSTPIGISVRLPETESSGWAALGDEERWCYELIGKVYDVINNNLLGLQYGAQMNGSDFIAHMPESGLQYISPESSRQTSPLFNSDNAVQFVGRAAGQPQAFMAASTQTKVTAFVGAFCEYLQENWLTIAAVTVAGAGVVAIVVTKVKDHQKSRPKYKKGAFEVVSICWNHDGDPKRGSLHYHSGGKFQPEKMTDYTGEKMLDTKCILVPSVLGNNGTVDIVLKYDAQSPDDLTKSGTFKVLDVDSGKDTFMGGKSADFTVESGKSVTISLPYDSSKLPVGILRKERYLWEFWVNDNCVTNCSCVLYTLAAEPGTPWVIGAGTAYDVSCPEYIWTEMLDWCVTDEKVSNFAAYAVEKMNASGFQYDVDAGRSFFMENYNGKNNQFKLEYFVKNLTEVPDNKKTRVNCADCSAIVSTACAMVGVDLKMVRLVPPYVNQGFACNKIQAIGFEEWKRPFNGGFAFHQFAVDLSGKTTPNSDSLVYDACLKVDGSDDPGDDSLDDKTRESLLPTGMKASLTANPQDNSYVVIVPNPLKQQVYLERLVKNGQICWFNANYVATPEFFFAAEGERRMTDKLTEALDGVKSLDILEEADEYQSVRFVWENMDFRVKYWHFDSDEEAEKQIKTELDYAATPLKYSGEEMDIQVGEHCFVIGETCIIFRRLGYVLDISSDSMESTRKLADIFDEKITSAKI